MAEHLKKLLDRETQVYQISTMVAGDFSLQEVLDKLAEITCSITKASSCSIRLLDDETGDLRMRSTYNISEAYRNKGDVTKEDPVIKQAFAGEAVIIDDSRDDDRIIYKDATRNEGLISQLTVAMSFKKRPMGVLRLYSSKPRAFDEDDIFIARLIASQCAVAITNARLFSQALEGARIAEQMRLAAVIQRRMIPDRAPCIPGLDIAAAYQPCFEIGGDLYDFIQINDHTLVVGVADVIGKGIPAAMMMSMFRGTIRAYSDGGYIRHTMDEIIGELNKVALRECRNGEFITLFVARIDVGEMTMTYCNCGHEPTLLIRNGNIIELDRGGLVLGIKEDTVYETETVPLNDRDTLLFYTDGLIDAVNFEGQFWGKDRLLDAIQSCCESSAEALINNLLAYRRRFVGLASQVDDTSIVVLRMDKEANCPCCDKTAEQLAALSPGIK